jgi:FAD/FMN-containing dehydrogenase
MTSFIERLQQQLKPGQCLVGKDIEPRYLCDASGFTEEQPLAIVRPQSVEDVSAVLRLCNDAGVPVVPQGGATGLAGGATPVKGGVVISMERMNGVIEIDAAAATLTAWAGTPQQVIQEAAWNAGFFYPVDFGSRGSCQIGGNVSTNAGGNRVIRYGMTRAQVLGLEAVLADGTVISSMNKMIKNNSGYDLKQLFIGTEGTLGVITRVVLRLQPQPRSTCTAMCAVEDFDKLIGLLNHMRGKLGASMSAFEVMWPDFFDLITAKVPNRKSPFDTKYGTYVLIETNGTDQVRDQELFEGALESAMETGLVADAVIAQSETEAKRLWEIRDGSGEFRNVLWPSVNFDISMPIGNLGKFIDAARAALHARWPDAQTVFFGHIGDSNIHITIKVGEGKQPEHEIDELIYGMMRDWNGAITAEHGVGVLKREYLGNSRSAEEIALMKTLKKALDPKGIMNPGKVF